MWIYIIMGGIFILSLVVQNSLKSKFAKYSKVALGVPMAGRDVAAAMLQQNGCGDVQVTSVSGQLTDHFNPSNRTVNLSEPVYGTNSIAAAAVAAHECGHAIQHKVGYSMLQLRTKMVPIVQFASNTVQWLLLAGIMIVQVTPIPLYIALAMFALTVLFSFVTLPVEVDASRRAVKWLEGSGIASGEQLTQAKDALRAAAYTYVVSALGSLATLLYYAAMLYLKYINRRKWHKNHLSLREPATSRPSRWRVATTYSTPSKRCFNFTDSNRSRRQPLRTCQR